MRRIWAAWSSWLCASIMGSGSGAQSSGRSGTWLRFQHRPGSAGYPRACQPLRQIRQPAVNSFPLTSSCRSPRSSPGPPDTMINAVLVFNNNGQPRLTKFYTQIVRKPSGGRPQRTNLPTVDQRLTNPSFFSPRAHRIHKRNNPSLRKSTISSPNAHPAPATSSRFPRYSRAAPAPAPRMGPRTPRRR
jgi:hypothetical protein